MININEYRDELEKRCLAAGLVKLDEPVNTINKLIDTMEVVYSAFEIIDEKDFDIMFFEPTVQALTDAIIKEEDNEFYRLDVFRKDNVFIFTSSRGDYSAEAVLSVLEAKHD